MRPVLVIDSHRAEAAALGEHLLQGGFEVALAYSARGGVAAARAAPPALVVLDLALPDVDGLRVLHALQQEAPAPPVLVVTRRDEVGDRLRAFALGADDYVVKPCHWPEVVARARAILRRGAADASPADAVPADAVPADAAPAESPPAAPPGAAPMCVGDVAVHPLARRVRRGGEDVPLSPKEYDLLLALLRNRGRAVARAELLAGVWGYAPGTTTRTVDAHVFTLRRKLEPDPERPRYILTVNRVGYRLAG